MKRDTANVKNFVLPLFNYLPSVVEKRAQGRLKCNRRPFPAGHAGGDSYTLIRVAS